MLYDFEGVRDNMLNIKKDEFLMLINKHDSKGNDKWWYVKNEKGNVGYVPSNYITFYQHNKY